MNVKYALKTKETPLNHQKKKKTPLKCKNRHMKNYIKTIILRKMKKKKIIPAHQLITLFFNTSIVCMDKLLNYFNAVVLK